MTIECPICGSNSLKKMRGQYEFKLPENMGSGMISISDTTWEECGACGEHILSTELHEALERERYRRLGLLLPQQIREIRKRAGLSQKEAAKILGVGEKTYTRWESGRSLQNKSSDNLIRLIDSSAELFVQLEAERNPERHEQITEYIRALENLKGKNELAVAAHGGELDSTTVKALRDKLLKVIDLKKRFGN
jgi:putative zinc finger/helix-turn-helix YgiT family protein